MVFVQFGDGIVVDVVDVVGLIIGIVVYIIKECMIGGNIVAGWVIIGGCVDDFVGFEQDFFYYFFSDCNQLFGYQCIVVVFDVGDIGGEDVGNCYVDDDDGDNQFDQCEVVMVGFSLYN